MLPLPYLKTKSRGMDWGKSCQSINTRSIQTLQGFVVDVFVDQTWQIHTFGIPNLFWTTCLHRIFGIPFNLLYISFGNPKMFIIDLEFNQKIKTGIRKSSLMPVSKYRLFCVVTYANTKKNCFLNVYQYSRDLTKISRNRYHYILNSLQIRSDNLKYFSCEYTDCKALWMQCRGEL